MIVALKPQGQLTVGDCGICCVAALSKYSYREVYETAKLFTRAPDTGMDLGDLTKTLDQLNFTPRYKRRWNHDEDDGILSLVLKKNPRGAGGHWVVLFNGSIFNPADGLFYRYDAYMESKPQYKAVGLLSLE